jgi:hypothetical protein
MANRRIAYIFLLIAGSISALAQEEGRPAAMATSSSAEQATEIDSTLTSSILAVLSAVEKIRPGMTRAELLKTFTEDGGLSFPSERTYVYRACPLIKVDIEFEPKLGAKNELTEENDDKIAKVSIPYLQYEVRD